MNMQFSVNVLQNYTVYNLQRYDIIRISLIIYIEIFNKNCKRLGFHEKAIFHIICTYKTSD